MGGVNNFQCIQLTDQCTDDIEYEFSLPFGLYVETCTSFYKFSGPTWPSSTKGRNIGHLSKYPTIRLLPIVGCHHPHTISLNTLSAHGVSCGLAHFDLCGKHQSHFYTK